MYPVITHLIMTTLSVMNGQTTGDYLENIRNIRNYRTCVSFFYTDKTLFTLGVSPRRNRTLSSQVIKVNVEHKNFTVRGKDSIS